MINQHLSNLSQRAVAHSRWAAVVSTTDSKDGLTAMARDELMRTLLGPYTARPI